MVYNRTSCDFNQPKRHLVLIGRVKSTETCEKLYLVFVLYKEEKLSFIPFQCLKIFKTPADNIINILTISGYVENLPIK